MHKVTKNRCGVYNFKAFAKFSDVFIQIAKKNVSQDIFDIFSRFISAVSNYFIDVSKAGTNNWQFSPLWSLKNGVMQNGDKCQLLISASQTSVKLFDTADIHRKKKTNVNLASLIVSPLP